ncbi:MAG TPA: hypothetical protein VEG38_01530 [Acidimicrobiia bacterium]|nr:hypothetical protein [Acidimicrobiia bacterium]
MGTTSGMERTPSSPGEPAPSPDVVSERASELTAEEKQAGVDNPEALADAVLTESEARTLDRTATAREHRTSEDTVEPPG